MEHVYERDVDEQANDSLAKVVSRIPHGAKVLDVGTGSGALGRFLKARDCAVDGVTCSSAEAQRAKTSYDHVHVVDLESVRLSDTISGGRYDVVVCADVLEHLRNAEQVLADLVTLLAPGGKIIVSIPNVTHLGIVLALMAGQFVRTREGLLDATHVRFVDEAGLDRLVADSGLVATERMAVRRALHETEFASVDLGSIPDAIRAYLATVENADIYQFVWVLEPSTSPVAPSGEAPAVPRIDVEPRFGAQIYLADGDGFSESGSRWVWGALGEGLQTLRFPDLSLEGVARLRLDVSDRAGVFEFLCFDLLDAGGQVLWQWGGSHDVGVTLKDLDCPLVPGRHGGLIFRATSDDPFVILDIPAGLGGSVAAAELKMTAPLRYEDAGFAWAYRHFRQQVDHLSEALGTALARERQATDRMLELQRALDAAHATTCWKLRERVKSLRDRLRRVYRSGAV